MQKKSYLTTAGLSILLCCTIVLFTSGKYGGANYEYKFLAPEMSSLDAVIEEEMAKQNIPGCAVGVVVAGKIVHVKAYGYLDNLHTKPVTINHVFRWASISKTVTAVAAFKAIEDGKLRLTDQVGKKVSYWPMDGNKGKITIANLLNHRGGINHYTQFNQAKYTANNNFNAQQSVDVFSFASLVNTPGTTYLYSTFGFNLLGAAVEAATGKPYETYVDDNISDKAGMNSMTAYASDPGGYVKDCNGIFKQATEGKVEWKLPGGGWSSNIYDLTRFMQGMANGTFLNNTAALWADVPNNGNYRFGIYKETLGSKTHVYHGGDHDDVETSFGFFPADKTGVCILIPGGSFPDKYKFVKKVENALDYSWSLDELPTNVCGSTDNCGHTMTAVWRNTGNANNVLLRRGYSTDEFNREWQTLLDLGYYADDIETWLDGSVRKWDGIFKKTTKKSAMWRGFEKDAFHDKWVEMSNNGYRLIDLETYLDGSTRKWAGTFIESSEGYYMFRDYSTEEFGDKYKELSDKNMKMVDVECYYSGNNQRWAGVWKGSGTSLLNRNYKTDDFVKLRSDREAAGYKLTDVETYLDGGVRKWAAIWEKADGNEYFVSDKKHCDMINTYHNPYQKSGYELMDLEKY